MLFLSSGYTRSSDILFWGRQSALSSIFPKGNASKRRWMTSFLCTDPVCMDIHAHMAQREDQGRTQCASLLCTDPAVQGYTCSCAHFPSVHRSSGAGIYILIWLREKTGEEHSVLPFYAQVQGCRDRHAPVSSIVKKTRGRAQCVILIRVCTG